jgi:hypothetical protein
MLFATRRNAMIVLPRKMRIAISAIVAAAAKQGQLVQVYAEAEKIRRAHIAENVALEEIVEALIHKSAGGPGYHSDPSEARAALLGEPIH